jgi:predicted nucleic acid-binding protein
VSFAVDANLLLYASDRESSLHKRAVELLDEIAMGPELAYLFWPAAMAYLRIATHPAIFARPLSHSDARANLESLLALPHVQAVGAGTATTASSPASASTTRSRPEVRGRTVPARLSGDLASRRT